MTTTNEAAKPSALSQLKIDRGGAMPGKRKIKWWPWVLAVLAVGGGVAYYKAFPQQTEVKITTVVTSTPSQQYVELTASGYVVAQRRSAVASKAAGRLVELRVREGSRIGKGDLIARIDASDINAAILGAEAAVHQAEAQVQQTKVQLINARAELARARSLQAQGFLSPQAVDQALTRNKAVFAQHMASQAALEQAQAAVKAQKVARDYTEIRAPFDGVVLVKNANIGDIITPMSSAAGAQGAVVTMADMDTLEVEADVSESSLSKARPGQPVEITLDALPDARLKGKVAGIVPTVDRAKATVMTKIQFEKIDPRVLPEMSAKVSFLSQPITNADQQPVMAVNPGALVERDGGSVVYRYVNRDGKETVEVVPVKAGRKLGDLRELSGQIHTGDKLVLDPSKDLRPGAGVKLAGS
jgi:RND family efflux transporter MFP subunit